MELFKLEERRFRTSIRYALGFVGILWAVKLLEWALHADFGVYGIYPRTLTGTVGILVSPLIHGDFTHLFSNTFPLAFLGVGIMFFYRRVAVDVFFLIYLLTGVSVWFLARQAYHIGASGLIYGLVSFLFFSGLIRKDLKSVTVSLVVLFMYSGMLQGIFPSKPGVSWESHLIGAVIGFGCAIVFRNIPLSVEETVVSEDTEVGGESPVNSTLPAQDDPPVIRYTFKENPPEVKPQNDRESSPRHYNNTYRY